VLIFSLACSKIDYRIAGTAEHMLNPEAPVRKLHSTAALARRWWVVLRMLGAAVCTCVLLACAARDTLPGVQSYEVPAGAIGEHHTVALLGATGMVGGYLLEEALARGFEVRALARTPGKLEAFRSRITIVQGDALDPSVVRELLHGSDVVISALGPVKADGAAALFVNATVTGNVLQAMQAEGISRYLIVSGAAVIMPGDERDLLGWWIRTLAQVALQDALQDKQAEYALLAHNTVDWTLVRCPLIDDQPFYSTALVSPLTPPAFRVRAGEVARFVLDQIDSRAFARQGPFLGSRRENGEQYPTAL
jgi:putative NADH-flavin reductase